MKKLLVFIGFIGLLTKLNAASFFSGFITYRHVNGNTFKVVLQLTASCQGIRPGSSMPLKINDSANSLSRTLSRVSVENITWNNPNTCNNQNNYGWELHTYESIIDFDTIGNNKFKNSCVIYLSSEMCCRPSSINTYGPGNGYVTCMMNRCKVKDNAGPSITHLKTAYFTINQTNYYNPIIMDTIDGDFLTFEMVNPLYDFNKDETYNNPYSARYPLSPFCSGSGQVNCSKLPLAQPPRGLYLDSLNGNLIFTSTKASEVGSIVYKVKEYRYLNGKKELIGYFYSDNWFVTGLGNIRPIITKSTLKLDYYVKAGDSLTIPIVTSSTDTFKADSVLITCYNPIKGSTYSISKKWRSDMTFKWKPECKDIRNEPYIFYLYMIGSDYRHNDPQTLAINIWVQSDLNLGNDTVICKNSTFTIQSNLIGKYEWNNSPSDTLSYYIANGPGTYKLKLERNGCVVADSIVLSELNSLPDVTLGKDTVVCDQAPASPIQLAVPYSPYVTYSWNIQSNYNSNIISFKDTGWVKVRGVNTCGEAVDSIHVDRMNSPTLNLPNDTLLCDVTTFTIDPLNSIRVNYLWDDGANDSIKTVDSSGVYKLKLENACGEALDSMHIQFKYTPYFTLGADTTVCDGDFPEFNLEQLDASILWSIGNTAKAFKPDRAGMVWARASNVCGVIMDTVFVANVIKPVINLGPDTILCKPFEFILKSTCEACTYVWSDNSSDSLLAVTEAGVYSLEASNYCGTMTDTLTIGADSIPLFSLPNDTALRSPFLFTIRPDKLIGNWLWSTGDTSSFIQVDSSGTYWMMQENRCGSGADTIHISEIVGVDDVWDMHVKLYPLPFNETLHIESDQEIVNFTLYTLDGKMVSFPWLSQGGHYSLDMENVASGIYVLVMENEHMFRKVLVSK